MLVGDDFCAISPQQACCCTEANRLRLSTNPCCHGAFSLKIRPQAWFWKGARLRVRHGSHSWSVSQLHEVDSADNLLSGLHVVPQLKAGAEADDVPCNSMLVSHPHLLSRVLHQVEACMSTTIPSDTLLPPFTNANSCSVLPICEVFVIITCGHLVIDLPPCRHISYQCWAPQKLDMMHSLGMLNGF